MEGAGSQQGLQGQMLAWGSLMEDSVSKQILSGARSPGRLGGKIPGLRCS